MSIRVHKFQRVFDVPETSKELCDLLMEAAKDNFAGSDEITATTLVFAKDKQFDQNLDVRELIRSNDQMQQLASSLKSICSEIDAMGFVIVCRMWMMLLDENLIGWSFTKELLPGVAVIRPPVESLLTIAQIRGQSAVMRAARVERSSDGKRMVKFTESAKPGADNYWPTDGILTKIL